MSIYYKNNTIYIQGSYFASTSVDEIYFDGVKVFPDGGTFNNGGTANYTFPEFYSDLSEGKIDSSSLYKTVHCGDELNYPIYDIVNVNVASKTAYLLAHNIVAQTGFGDNSTTAQYDNLLMNSLDKYKANYNKEEILDKNVIIEIPTSNQITHYFYTNNSSTWKYDISTKTGVGSNSSTAQPYWLSDTSGGSSYAYAMAYNNSTGTRNYVQTSYYDNASSSILHTDYGLVPGIFVFANDAMTFDEFYTKFTNKQITTQDLYTKISMGDGMGLYEIVNIDTDRDIVDLCSYNEVGTSKFGANNICTYLTEFLNTYKANFSDDIKNKAMDIFVPMIGQIYDYYKTTDTRKKSLYLDNSYPMDYWTQSNQGGVYNYNQYNSNYNGYQYYASIFSDGSISSFEYYRTFKDGATDVTKKVVIGLSFTNKKVYTFDEFYTALVAGNITESNLKDIVTLNDTVMGKNKYFEIVAIDTANKKANLSALTIYEYNPETKTKIYNISWGTNDSANPNLLDTSIYLFRQNYSSLLSKIAEIYIASKEEIESWYTTASYRIKRNEGIKFPYFTSSHKGTDTDREAYIVNDSGEIDSISYKNEKYAYDYESRIFNGLYTYNGSTSGYGVALAMEVCADNNNGSHSFYNFYNNLRNGNITNAATDSYVILDPTLTAPKYKIVQVDSENRVVTLLSDALGTNIKDEFTSTTQNIHTELLDYAMGKSSSGFNLNSYNSDILSKVELVMVPSYDQIIQWFPTVGLRRALASTDADVSDAIYMTIGYVTPTFSGNNSKYSRFMTIDSHGESNMTTDSPQYRFALVFSGYDVPDWVGHGGFDFIQFYNKLKHGTTKPELTTYVTDDSGNVTRSNTVTYYAIKYNNFFTFDVVEINNDSATLCLSNVATAFYSNYESSNYAATNTALNSGDTVTPTSIDNLISLMKTWANTMMHTTDIFIPTAEQLNKWYNNDPNLLKKSYTYLNTNAKTSSITARYAVNSLNTETNVYQRISESGVLTDISASSISAGCFAITI